MLLGQNYISATLLYKKKDLWAIWYPHESLKLQVFNLYSLLHINFKSLSLKYYSFFLNTFLSIKKFINSLKETFYMYQPLTNLACQTLATLTRKNESNCQNQEINLLFNI
jgi:hypothetical protein